MPSVVCTFVGAQRLVRTRGAKYLFVNPGVSGFRIVSVRSVLVSKAAVLISPAAQFAAKTFEERKGGSLASAVSSSEAIEKSATILAEREVCQTTSDTHEYSLICGRDMKLALLVSAIT